MNARKSIKTSKLSIAAFHEEPFLSQAVNSQNKPFYRYVYKITKALISKFTLVYFDVSPNRYFLGNFRHVRP